MGLLDKLMFWRKREEPLGAEPGLNMEPGLPTGEMPEMEPGLPGEKDLGLGMEEPSPSRYPGMRPMNQGPMPGGPSAFGEQQQFTQSSTLSKDMEIISAKLDSVRAMLENLSQRVAHIERIASESEHETPQRREVRW